jgi:hypothetical protein
MAECHKTAQEKDLIRIAMLLGQSIDDITKKMLNLGIEYLYKTDPCIHEARINELLPDGKRANCVVGEGNTSMSVLVVRVSPDDNKYIYRHIFKMARRDYEESVYQEIIEELLPYYGKDNGSRKLLSGNDYGSGLCIDCVSLYDGSPIDVNGVKRNISYMMCTKDCQGVGIHPDFPCSLHEFNED